MWSKSSQSQVKNSYEHQWNLDFGGSEKGRIVKIRTSKSQFKKSLSSADFFPKVHLKSVEGQAGKRASSQ